MLTTDLCLLLAPNLALLLGLLLWPWSLSLLLSLSIRPEIICTVFSLVNITLYSPLIGQYNIIQPKTALSLVNIT